jgi:hypothetical protein
MCKLRESVIGTEGRNLMRKLLFLINGPQTDVFTVVLPLSSLVLPA